MISVTGLLLRGCPALQGSPGSRQGIPSRLLKPVLTGEMTGLMDILCGRS
jgi:hypothetical protein